MSGNQVGRRTAEKAKIICPPPVGGHNKGDISTFKVHYVGDFGTLWMTLN